MNVCRLIGFASPVPTTLTEQIGKDEVARFGDMSTFTVNTVDSSTNGACTGVLATRIRGVGMIVIVGLVVLLVAVIVGFTGVLTNAGPDHLLTENFSR